MGRLTSSRIQPWRGEGPRPCHATGPLKPAPWPDPGDVSRRALRDARPSGTCGLGVGWTSLQRSSGRASAWASTRQLKRAVSSIFAMPRRAGVALPVNR
jgi:hypothetical protein